MDVTHNSRQLTMLVVLRMLMGWHFLHQGVQSFRAPGEGALYLLGPDSLLPEIFRMVSTRLAPFLLQLTGPLNTGLLIVTGVSLVLGCYARYGKALGIMLLAACYVAYLPLGPLESRGALEVVNAYLLEAAALSVLFVFPTSHLLGLDRFVALRPAARRGHHNKRNPVVKTAA